MKHHPQLSGGGLVSRLNPPTLKWTLRSLTSSILVIGVQPASNAASTAFKQHRLGSLTQACFSRASRGEFAASRQPLQVRGVPRGVRRAGGRQRIPGGWLTPRPSCKGVAASSTHLRRLPPRVFGQRTLRISYHRLLLQAVGRVLLLASPRRTLG